MKGIPPAVSGLALIAVAACAQANAAETAATDIVTADPGALAAIRVVSERAVESAAASLLTSPALRGFSGSVRVVVLHPGAALDLPEELAGVRIQFVALGNDADTIDGTPPTPGVWTVLVRAGDVIRRLDGLHVLTSVGLEAKRDGRVGAYRVGDWPFERQGRPTTDAYLPPPGLIEVHTEHIEVPVSDHLRLGDLLTKGQNDVWPKYLVLDPRALDKVELTLDELENAGHDVGRVGVISGFRTPWYNANGGSTGGRGSLSRHMYGDAIDLFVDHDGDGRMDDLNRDGRVDRRDAAYLAGVAHDVEKAHPELTGGIGTYSPRPGAHSGFVHIDARGTRARW